MAYIGNARSVLIIGNNVRDDLVPNADGTKKTFELSQEVPGGYEANIIVIRKLYKEGEETFWEILEPEGDYTVGGTETVYNRLLTLKDAPQVNDQVYVLHKGEATYNFVPSPKSVGPDQLSENLRTFITESFTGDGNKTEFLLSQSAISINSLLISIDGVIIDDCVLSSNGNKITFTSAPTSGSKIRVLHLSFSTISRRASFVPGQEPATIEENSIYTAAIQNDSVSGSKILLNNSDSIRSKKSSTGESEIIKLDIDDNTTIITPNSLKININTNNILTINSDSILPSTSNTLSLGSVDKKIKDINMSGSISLDGTVDGIDISSFKSEFETFKTTIQNQINSIIPVGMIMLSSSNTTPQGWLICDGSSISRSQYPTLFAQIGTTFGNIDNTTFNLPDLRNRVPLGSNNSLGANDGVSVVANRSISHSHTVSSHTHGLSSHTHTIPGHYHSMGIGSDLNITSGGSHTTNIDISHGHNAFSEEHSSNITLLDPGHNHIINIIDPGHTHIFSRSGGSSSNTSSDILAKGHNNNVHNHNTSSNYILSRSPEPNSSNQITIKIDNALTGISATSNQKFCGITLNDSKHSHNIIVNDLINVNKQHIGGEHTHTSNSFTGRIGLVTNGVDGNTAMTSGSPSTSSTESSSPGTDSKTIPHLSVNFIIKVS
jgi:microcystin-dependent protein